MYYTDVIQITRVSFGSNPTVFHFFTTQFLKWKKKKQGMHKVL